MSILGILGRLCSSSTINRFNRAVVILKQRTYAEKIICRAMSASCLSLDNLNPNIKKMNNIVVGPLDIRAREIQKELEKGVKKPFAEIINATMGDCHAMGEAPITFVRQVLALVAYPPLLEHSDFPEDTKERARTILSGCSGGSVGSYTESSGVEVIRKHVAQYIENRDGIHSDWQNIVVAAGSSDAVKKILKLFIDPDPCRKPGVMVPIPHNPLYSAAAAEFGIQEIGYDLDESRNWCVDIAELQKAIIEARNVSLPRALVVINPGDPTGQVLSKENMEEIIKFAHREKLFLLADEVYQDNVFDAESKFFSFKKVLTEMGEPYSKMELASFMSCSKGYAGEAGFRGGYTEIINMCPKVKSMYLKANSAMLCPTVLGQACLDAIVRPPTKGEPSYDLWMKEKSHVLNSFKMRAEIVVDAFNKLEGFKCNNIQGSMYAFPRITLSQKAIDAAKNAGLKPDVFYARELLENTGICVAPGSSFGQKPGTFHFRTTILPQLDKIKLMLELLAAFHKDFLTKYS